MLNRVRDWWERLGRNNQMIVGLTALAVFVAALGFLTWARTPEYTLLYSNLSAPDASAITEKLKESNIPYRTSQNSTAIEVPAQQHDELLMKFATMGLPNSGTPGNGDDILNKASISDTSDMEQLRMRRALEANVAKSIMTLDQVGSAVVHYAPADNSPYALSNHDSTAAVLLTLKPGQTLSDETVRAIVNITRMSYTGLAEKNISVADSKGDLLWDGAHAGGTEGSERFKQQRELALAKRTDLQAALDRTIGPHKTVVLTHYELNSDELKVHKTITEPGIARQKTDETEELQGQGTVKNAAVGANGNVGGANNAPIAGGAGIPSYTANSSDPNGRYKHETTSTTYDPSVTTEDRTQAPGRIEKLTVSVLLDSKAVKPEELPGMIANVKQIVENNIGYDAADTTHTRSVTVAAVPFDRSEEQQAAKAAADAAAAENTRRLMTMLVPFAIMMGALFLMARAFRKPGASSAMNNGQLALAGGGNMGSVPVSEFNDTLLLDAEGNPIPGQTVGGEPGVLGLTSNSVPHTYEVIEEAFDASLESILHLTRAKPEMVAMLVKSWISDEQ